MRTPRARGRRIRYGRLAGPVLLLALWAAARRRRAARSAQAVGAVDDPVHRVVAVDVRQVARQPADLLAAGGLGLGIGIVAGTMLAVLAGLSRLGEALVDGTIQVQQAIPFLGLLPLLVLWLGIGEGMKVVIIPLGVTISTYINTYAALAGIDRRYIELAEVLGLSARWCCPARCPASSSGCGWA